jgi:hypothetical protein
MSLAQYLALGKSIENVNGDARYKVTAQPVAPDFTGGKAPARKRESNLEILNLFDQSQMPAARPPAAQEANPMRAPAAAGSVVQAQFTPQDQNERPARRWLGAWGKNHSSAQRQQAVAVQRELALGMVRPVRNDLNESDLEAVPMASPPPAAAGEQPLPPFWRRWPKRLWDGARGRA